MRTCECGAPTGGSGFKCDWCKNLGVLGLRYSATEAEIKKAYRKLALKYHPDTSGEQDSYTPKFIALKEAYEDLEKHHWKNPHTISTATQSPEAGTQEGVKPWDMDEPPLREDPEPSPFKKAAEYWVSRDGGPVSGPYTIEQLRHLVSGRMGEKLQYLGKILITDLAKTDAMEEWVRVDRVLAAAPGDNTSDYWVLRNGQMSGPYTLAGVADWAINGRILYTDQVKNIAMPEWLTVERALSNAGFSVPSRKGSPSPPQKESPSSPPPPPPPPAPAAINTPARRRIGILIYFPLAMAVLSLATYLALRQFSPSYWLPLSFSRYLWLAAAGLSLGLNLRRQWYLRCLLDAVVFAIALYDPRLGYMGERIPLLAAVGAFMGSRALLLLLETPLKRLAASRSIRTAMVTAAAVSASPAIAAAFMAGILTIPLHLPAARPDDAALPPLPDSLANVITCSRLQPGCTCTLTTGFKPGDRLFLLLSSRFTPNTQVTVILPGRSPRIVTFPTAWRHGAQMNCKSVPFIIPGDAAPGIAHAGASFRQGRQTGHSDTEFAITAVPSARSSQGDSEQVKAVPETGPPAPVASPPPGSSQTPQLPASGESTEVLAAIQAWAAATAANDVPKQVSFYAEHVGTYLHARNIDRAFIESDKQRSFDHGLRMASFDVQNPQIAMRSADDATVTLTKEWRTRQDRGPTATRIRSILYLHRFADGWKITGESDTY